MLFGSNGNSYTVCTVSDMRVYIYRCCAAQYGDAGRAKEITKIGSAVNVAGQGNLYGVRYVCVYRCCATQCGDVGRTKEIRRKWDSSERREPLWSRVP